MKLRARAGLVNVSKPLKLGAFDACITALVQYSQLLPPVARSADVYKHIYRSNCTHHARTPLRVRNTTTLVLVAMGSLSTLEGFVCGGLAGCTAVRFLLFYLASWTDRHTLQVTFSNP